MKKAVFVLALQCFQFVWFFIIISISYLLFFHIIVEEMEEWDDGIIRGKMRRKKNLFSVFVF